MSHAKEKVSGSVPASQTASTATPARRRFSAWERAMERWFDDAWRRPFGALFPEPERWGPFAELRTDLAAMDVHETDGEIVVKVDLPGVKKEEIQVELRDSSLFIKGERKKEEEIREEDYYRSERSFGSFSRVIPLPVEVKADGIKATFKDGVLEIRLSKTEASKKHATKIAVQ